LPGIGNIAWQICQTNLLGKFAWQNCLAKFANLFDWPLHRCPPRLPRPFCRRHVRRAAVQVLSTGAHTKPGAIVDHLPAALPLLYEQTAVNKALIRTVDLGPFKHQIDDGLELRKVGRTGQGRGRAGACQAQHRLGSGCMQAARTHSLLSCAAALCHHVAPVSSLTSHLHSAVPYRCCRPLLLPAVCL
jgi:hypothetical protein